MLYDCRKDTFIPGVSLWDDAAIKTDMSVKPQPRTSFHFTASDSLSEKASLLDVNASLKASFLGGLVEVGGSAKYLKDKTSSMHQCRVTMQYKQTTEYKYLTMTQLGNVTYPQVFDQQTATHVVTAVLYGAEAFMVFDQMASGDKEKQDIKGNLKVMIKRIPYTEISGKGKVVLTDEEKKKVEKFSCTFHGDFTLQQNPSTYEEAVLVYKQLPQLLGEKGEKAVPVRVWLYPLKSLDSKAAKLVREIREQLVSEVETVMEQLHEASMRANDLMTQCEAIKVTIIKDKLTKFQGKLRGYTVPLQHNLGKLLPAIRAGSAEEQKLVNILKSHDGCPFTQSKMSKWLDGKESEVERLRSYINNVPSFPIASPGPELDNILFGPKGECVIVFSFTSLKYEEPYLSSLSEYLASESESRKVVGICEEGRPWYSNPKISKRMAHVLKYAENLVKYFKDYKPIISYMSDTASPGASIHVYHYGDLIINNLQDTVTLQEVREGVNRVTLRVSPALQYRVEHSQTQGGAQEAWTVINTPANQEELTIPGLQPITEYQVRLSFTTAEGTSLPGKVFQIHTRGPSPPGKLDMSSVHETSVCLSWDRPTDMEGVPHTFRVTWGNSREQSESITTDENPTVLSHLRPGTEYSISVCTVLQSTGLESEPVHTTTCTEPSAPERLRVEEVRSRSVRLRWDPPTKMEGVSYTFSITYTCDGEEPKGQTTGSSSSSADLCDLKPGVEYSFSICTVLHNGSRSRACSAQTHSCETLNLVLVGLSGVGKSAAGNTILGREEFKSETSSSSVTLESEGREGEVCGRRVTVVDTPGLFNTELSGEKLREEMDTSLCMCDPGPHAFLLVIQLGRFTQQEKRVMETLQKLFSERVDQHTMVLFTYGDKLRSKTIEEFISKVSNLPQLLQKCGNRYHVFNNEDMENRYQVADLLQKIDEMVAANGGGCYTTEM